MAIGHEGYYGASVSEAASLWMPDAGVSNRGRSYFGGFTGHLVAHRAGEDAPGTFGSVPDGL